MSPGELIRARRTELGISQAQLAERAGTGQAFVSRVESGKTAPTLSVLRRLAAALGCDLTLGLTPRAGSHCPGGQP
ncbi:helix-turn-helix domain-containing protein [Actinacidiphila acidipaludis]|uniref:Helix-turn-helix domain-containing protein n=1 Tax=Actinacidiphila acidipaludis TaxID=2873382 RepID=A0ABS7QDB2_9ACTN|nr:helix-turn-helix transcriptional regulator [Streptomyces acidipaludis]MBY8879947.1 helix-turn-helix domain-containing protein [Streptomyces acidipaludis]